MQIHTTARHCDLDPEDRLHAEHRFAKLERYARDLQEGHLILTAEKYRHTAEITLKLKHQDLVGSEESNGARLAIDGAFDRVEEQLRRLKERRIDRKQRAASDRTRGASAPAGAGEGEDEIGVEEDFA